MLQGPGIDFDLSLMDSKPQETHVETLKRRYQQCDFDICAMFAIVDSTSEWKMCNFGRTIRNHNSKRVNGVKTDITLFSDCPGRVFRLIKVLHRFSAHTLHDQLALLIKNIQRQVGGWVNKFIPEGNNPHCGASIHNFRKLLTEPMVNSKAFDYLIEWDVLPQLCELTHTQMDAVMTLFRRHLVRIKTKPAMIYNSDSMVYFITAIAAVSRRNGRLTSLTELPNI